MTIEKGCNPQKQTSEEKKIMLQFTTNEIV